MLTAAAVIEATHFLDKSRICYHLTLAVLQQGPQNKVNVAFVGTDYLNLTQLNNQNKPL